jgi:hypothetical protein
MVSISILPTMQIPSDDDIGVCDGSRTWFPLFRSRQKKVRAVPDVGMYGQLLNHQLSVVFLGILPYLLTNWYQRLHRQPCTFRSHENPWPAESRISPYFDFAVCLLPST